MTRKTTKKSILAMVLMVAALGLIYAYFQPHRNVQSTPTDYKLSASALVKEYIVDPAASNRKYLSEDGNSKILEIEGLLKGISTDFRSNPIYLIQNPGDPAGVRCTMIPAEIQVNDNQLIGKIITIKGAMVAGAGYDQDLGIYEHVLLEQCQRLK